MGSRSCPRILFCHTKINRNICLRHISKYIHKDISSKSIRQKFLDYFIKSQEHTFVRSSPVVPFCDPTVPFVNAGMNQFKGIFLETQTPHFTRVTNSQKCIRVGGKHNDLNVVGKDGYHHTFFEMLGNWSFGDYFKEDACKMAWEVLTEVYKIPPSRLYVTYFGGDEKFGLSSDVETRDIWRSIGWEQFLIPDERILAFGAKDNFWEMGLTGPCGPCTEIHFDHLGSVNRSEFVNKDLHDLTEIWNLVFIQYHRLPDGSISVLPKKHVDTGLGLERLCCALQGKLSTYETDLFDYLIKAIEKNCSNIQKYSGKFGEHDWNEIDTAYRVLADHMRMITVCLADGVIPEENQKLKRIMRKCFILSETVFGKERGLIKELSNYVVENLGDVYPELERNIRQIHQVINYEEEVYSAIRKQAKKDWNKFSVGKTLPNIDSLDITPSFIKAFKELYVLKPDEIDADWAYRLYDTHGFDSEAIEQLAEVLKIKFNPETYEKKMNEIKAKSRSNRQVVIREHLVESLIDLGKTEDSTKYTYSKVEGEYTFPDTSCRVLRIVDKDQFASEVKSDKTCGLILDRTNLYSEAGGQESDKGKIVFESGTFHVESLSNINGLIVHRGFLKGSTIQVGSEGIVTVNSDYRLNNMKNHTSAHLLNAAIKRIKSVSCQKSSRVTHEYVNLDVSVFGEKLDVDDIVKVEEDINRVIKDGVEVRISTTDSQGLYSYDQVTLIPGETYPDNEIRIVEIDDGNGFISREPCCGTHVLNTADLEDFCVISLKSLGRSTSSIHAVTGNRAKLARKNAAELSEDISTFKRSLKEHLDKPEMLDMGVLSLKQRLKFDLTDESILPYVYKSQVLSELDSISRQIKNKNNDDLRSFVDMEMYDAISNRMQTTTKSNKKYMVHYLRSSMMFESVPLERATEMCSDIPVIVLAYSDSMVKARCSVPKNLQSKGFDAETWLKELASIFNAKITRQKLQDGVLVCNMKAKKVHLQDWHHLLAQSLENAKKYAEDNL